MRVAIEFPPAIPDINRSMSTILYVIRDFDQSIEPVNLVAQAHRTEEGAILIEDEEEEEEDPSEDK